MKNENKSMNLEEWWIESDKCPSDIYLKTGRRLLGPFNRENNYDWQKVHHGLMRGISRDFPEKHLKIPYKRVFGWFRIIPDKMMMRELHKLQKDVTNGKLRVLVW